MKNLTPTPVIAQNQSAGNKPAGRGNLFSIGVNTPLTLVVFLCASYCAVLCRLLIMAGCFGHSKEWLATNTQYFHPIATRLQCRGKHVRRFTSLSIGVSV